MSSSTRMSAHRRIVTCVSIVAVMGGGLLAGCDSNVESSAVAGDPATPTATSAPTNQPTDLPSATAPTDLPSASAPTAPAPSEPPTTTDPTDPPSTTSPNGKLTAAEYADDWNFALGGVTLKADHVRGKDYADCTGLEVKDALSSRGCKYGVKVTFTALGGKVMFTHMILEMANEAKATKFANDKSLTDSDFNYVGEDIVADFDKGQWRARSAGKYVVITVCTGTKSATEKQVKDYLHYANADFTSALLWR